jgi:hypothetical protein
MTISNLMCLRRKRAALDAPEMSKKKEKNGVTSLLEE